MAKSLMADKLHEECKIFDIQLRLDRYMIDLQQMGNIVRSNPGYFFLEEFNEQIIVDEVKLGSHLWSVIGKLINFTEPDFGSGTFHMLVFVCVQPGLNTEESATLEVSYTYSDRMSFEIRPSTISCSKYGPYEIKCAIPALRDIMDYGKLSLTLGTGIVCDLNCVNFAKKQPNPTSADNLLEYSNQLFQNHELSDLTLKIRGKEFPAHKLLLSSSSPVFKAMFLNDFSESRSNVIEIKDFEFEVIREMLKSIYTHKPPNFRSPKGKIDAASLYKAAHKYQIQYLLVSCREELLSTFNIESALDVLLLADTYDDALLKEKVLDFICKNPSAVADVSKYREVARQRPSLMQDILTCKFKQK